MPVKFRPVSSAASSAASRVLIDSSIELSVSVSEGAGVDHKANAPVSAPLPSVTSEPITESSSLSSMLASIEEQHAVYGGNLSEALANLVTLVEKEGVAIQEIRDGFIAVNKILLADPSLCTECMLPLHLGYITLAARKLTDIAMEAGGERKAKTSASKEAKAAEAKVKAAKDALLAAAADGLDF
jgi:hypothetical protein